MSSLIAILSSVFQVYEETLDIEEDTEMAIETITKAGEKYLAMKSLHKNDWYQELYQEL